MTSRRIVVGLSESTSSDAAVLWAAQKASTRCASLVVVHGTGGVQESDPSRATRLVDDAVRAVSVQVPGVRAHGECSPLDAADALIAQSAVAELVVVGRGSDSTGLGPVTRRVAAYGQTPIVVVGGGQRLVREGAEPGDDFVVGIGVGRSKGAWHAMDEAFGSAQRNHGRVVAVRVWNDLDGTAPGGPPADSGPEAASRAVLDEHVAQGHAAYPTVPVETRLVRGNAIDVLLDLSAECDLLILGGRLRAGDETSQLSRDATTVLARSRCPVAIVGWPRLDLRPDSATALLSAQPTADVT